jgi:hypothetical protein
VIKAVFLFALIGRSGTNYLANLLTLHSNLRLATSPFLEDWFLSNAHLLTEYAKALASTYQERGYPNHANIAEQITQEIGSTLLRLLGEPKEQEIIVTKTPSLEGIENFQSLFGDRKSLVLLRDGRAIAESFERSFGTDKFLVAKNWAKSVRVFEELRGNALEDSFIVKYEDLLENTSSELGRIFHYLDLPELDYDYSKASNLPVVGSSTFGITSHGVSWTPIARDPNFRPLERFSHWSAEEHLRFNDIAGSELEVLGYRAM